MTAALFAELTGDGQRIVLIPEGEDWELNEIAARLKMLTAKLTFLKDDGQPARTTAEQLRSQAVLMPATWASVVQLGFSFNGLPGLSFEPQPKLESWIVAETIRRTSPRPSLPPELWPPWLEPRKYQVEGAEAIAAEGKFLLLDDPGLGKTATAILGLEARRRNGHDIFPMIITVPSWEVADAWATEISTWAPGWPEPVLHRGPGRFGKAGSPRALPGGSILITTYATLRADAADMRGPLVRLKAATVVADEFHLCVSHDTLITVPGGVKTICNIKPGDLVRGVDHQTGLAVWTRVRQVLRSPLRPLVSVGGARLTEEHPVWISDSGSLSYDDAYDHGHDYLRVVRETRGETAQAQQASTPVLRHQLLSQMADVPPGLRGLADHAKTAGAVPEEYCQGSTVPGIPGIHQLRPEPVQEHGPCHPGESTRYPVEPGLAPVAGRERHGAYYPAGEIARAAGAALGTGAANPDWHAPWFRLPAGLQGGHREPEAESGRRSAWPGTQPGREPAGPEETGPSGIPGLDRAVGLERADHDRSLWNLETDTGNYYANGFLVHNCKNPLARQSLALVRTAKSATTFTGMSGTGIKQDTGDIQPVLEAAWPDDWPSKERLVTRYCTRIAEDYGAKITGLNPSMEPEFFAILGRNMRRAAKADVLDQLPPKIYSVRRPEIPPEWAHAYKTLEEDMLGQLPDGGELPVMSTLARMMRLSQLASSAADVTITEELDEATGMLVPKYTVTLKAPSWKADSLLEIMAERPGQPVVCFTASRQLAMITGQAAASEGYRVGYIVGTGGGITGGTRKAAIGDFQDGKLDLIVATAKAGGTGITLTRSGTAVFLQRDWELDHGTQPEDRLHRIGQEHDSVEIIDIVAKGTVEDRVRQRLREKAGMLGQFVRDSRLVKEILGGIR